MKKFYLTTYSSLNLWVRNYFSLLGLIFLFSGIGLSALSAQNDACTGALSISIYGDASTGQSNATTVSSGTIDEGVAAPSCHTAGGQDDDVWYHFTGPFSGSKVVISTIAGTQSDWAMAVYDACGGSEIACSDDANSFMPEIELCQFDYTAGTSYYIRIFTYSTGVTGTCQLYLYEDTACPTPPANNFCAAAASISTDCANTTAGTTVNATTPAGISNPSCDLFGTINDVWYSFTTNSNAAATYDVTISNATGTIESTVYAGSCGSLSEVAGTCALGDRTITLSGLAVNTTHYVRVWSNPGSEGTFDICQTLDFICKIDFVS